MKLPWLSVFIQTPVIIHPVGQIGTFLNLCNQRTCANGMNRSRLDIEQIVLLHLYLLEISFHGSVFQAFFQLLPADVLIKTIDQPGILCRIQHIPHFRLAEGAVLMFPCIVVIRMHLHGQILSGIDKLDQNRKPAGGLRVSPHIFRMLF